jgi:hypothetical protein
MKQALITFALATPPGLALGYVAARWIVGWGQP